MNERERAGVEHQLRSWVVHFTDLHEVVKYARALESHFGNTDHPTYGSERCRLLAMSGLAVMYYRSFTCEDFIPLNITDKRFRFPDDQPLWKALHNEIKYHRMGSIAHADDAVRGVMIDPDFSLSPDGVVQSSEYLLGSNFAPMIGDMADWLASTLDPIIEKLYVRLHGKRPPESFNRPRIEITEIGHDETGRPASRSGHPVWG